REPCALLVRGTRVRGERRRSRSGPLPWSPSPGHSSLGRLPERSPTGRNALPRPLATTARRQPSGRVATLGTAAMLGRGRPSPSARSSRYRVDLYEYQGKQLFGRFGIPVSDGQVAETPEEARLAAEEIGGPVVVKAQVLTGGRGKAGGVKLADGPAHAEAQAQEILGLDINSHVVHKLWVEKDSDIAQEYYPSVTFARGAKKPLFMFTPQGGIEIQQVAEENPDALVRLHVDPLEGYQPWIARRLVYGGKVEDPSEQKQIAAIVEQLYAAFVEFDAMLCEINPLIVTPEGEVKARAPKFTVDDSALPRHPDIAEWRDPTAADPIETFAREKGVTYVKLDGNVGVLANGAGLGMSTVDVVAHAGGRPANFCDL